MLSYFPLTKAMKLEVRDVSRDCLLDANGKKEEALALVDEYVTDAMQCRFGSILTAILIGLAIQLAKALILYWIEQNFMSPPEGAFVEGEPGA